jgi:hypothetical protein
MDESRVSADELSFHGKDAVFNGQKKLEHRRAAGMMWV